jgi:predicted AlkP superfamily phosphohydrolase/phosphomutase
MPRLCVIGLDCLTPQLVFGRFRGLLPNLERLAANGMAGRIESTVPPITVPAWTVAVTGVDPGQLGVYGFRDRADRSYDQRRLASSMSYLQPPVWTRLTRAGLRSFVLGVPQTYPPKPLNGRLLTGMLTPSRDVPHTYPEDLASEVNRVAGGTRFDVETFRTDDKERLRDEIYDVTARRFRVARDWIARPDWDFFMMVELGPDRMHHGFWRYLAPDHPAYSPGHPLEHAIRDYTIELDREIGTLLQLLTDDVIVMVVSDHGAQTLHGCIALNQWLIERGDLVLHRSPRLAQPLAPDDIDWARTRAWADGGYVGRIHLNVAGREPNGIVSDPARLSVELAAALREIRSVDGRALDTRVLTVQEAYGGARGVPPDLTVYFDDLRLRAVGSVGHPSIHVPTNDTGPDDANHARHGVLILQDGRGRRPAPETTSLLDVAPTVLDRLGLPVPAEMSGRPLP